MLKAKEAVGYKIVIDARNGKVLSRLNLVHNFAEGNKSKAAGEAYTFDGELAATDGACSSEGPFAIGAGNRALDGFGAATVPLNDLVLQLWKDGVLLVSSRHAVLAGAVPLRAGRRRAGGQLRDQDVRLPRRSWLGRAADVHRDADGRRLAGACGVSRPLEDVPGQPAAAHG